MSEAFEISAIGLQAQQKALDIIANNIANLNTTSFKRSDVRFSEVMTQAHDIANRPANLGSSELSTAGVLAHAALALDEPGELEHTGRQLDLAIDGAGFIELLGAHGQTLLWRGGNLAVQEDGLLAAADGAPLRAMITVPDDATALQIGANGLVTARVADSDAAVELGRIMLVRLENATALERTDGGFYRAPDDARLNEVEADDQGMGAFVQGAVERSNVDINDEMVRLMVVQRAYAANAQIVQAADQMMAIANSLRR